MKRLMQVKGVDFLLTFKCPSKCKHCSYRAGPERVGSMELADAEGYLEELTSTQRLQSIGAHGGEPFLYFDLLRGIMEKAKELKVPQTWAITNGYWAKDKASAIERLAELKEAGLTCITFSVDGFHQEYIAFESVRNGIEAAASLGFDRICVDGYFLNQPDRNNPYDRSTRRMLETLGKLGGAEVHRYQVGFEGRAASELIKQVVLKTEMPNGRCQLPFWIGGDLKNPEGIEIDFEGNVTLCPGICLGNTRRSSLTRILQSYDVNEHPILSIIAKKGPIGLFKAAAKKGFTQHAGFVDECHLCYETRRFLRPHYPEYLAPENCY